MYQQSKKKRKKTKGVFNMAELTRVVVKPKFVELIDALISEKRLIRNRKDATGVFLDLINSGYYDEVFEKNSAKSRHISMEKEKVIRAREHVKEIGIKNIDDALDLIIDFELENEETDFQKEFARFHGVDDEVEEETIDNKEVTKDEEL